RMPARQEPRHSHDEDRADHEPRDAGTSRAARTEAGRGQREAPEPVEDAVGGIGARGLAVPRLEPAARRRRRAGTTRWSHPRPPPSGWALVGPAGRGANGRPGVIPQRLRTSARRPVVTSPAPCPRAWASAAPTTIARAKAAPASRRARAAGSHASW